MSACTCMGFCCKLLYCANCNPFDHLRKLYVICLMCYIRACVRWKDIQEPALLLEGSPEIKTSLTVHLDFSSSELEPIE